MWMSWVVDNPMKAESFGWRLFLPRLCTRIESDAGKIIRSICLPEPELLMIGGSGGKSP
jgi:hypothetical protein